MIDLQIKALHSVQHWIDETGNQLDALPNVAQESPLPSRGGMNCDSFYRVHMAR